MNITLHTEPFHYLIIKNLWSEKEHKEMLDEMFHLESKKLFLSPEDTGGAKDEDGNVLKKNKAVWLDNVWLDRNYSSVLTHNRKIFDFINENAAQESWYFQGLKFDNDSTLISYYENSDYYAPHRDHGLVTALSYFFVEPKKFNGGEIIFTDYDLKFEVTNNLTIVFPSNIKHEVSEISLDEKHKDKGLGRFCMNQFLDFINYTRA
jgi:Rps23 Pro-64 3,4-dihydroxylase Tpa1-like proline 4-hydroxylase